MKNIFLKRTALLLALLTLLSLLAACADTSTTNKPNAPASDSSSINTESSASVNAPTKEQTESKNEASSDSSASPTVSPSQKDEESQSPSESKDELAINKSNALEKMKAAYAATMAASSLRTTGEASSYEAGAGKGDTVVYPITYACTKGENNVFSAVLSTKSAYYNNDAYFSGEDVYFKSTDNETGKIEINHTKENALEMNIENTLMPVLNANLSITSFENVFTRLCETNYGIEFKDGIYSIYFYGTYTELSRIFLEDEMYESFLEQDVESVFPQTTGSVEIMISEDGYFVGMTTKAGLVSPERTLRTSLSYTFTDIGKEIVVEAPEWISEAK